MVDAPVRTWDKTIWVNHRNIKLAIEKYRINGCTWYEADAFLNGEKIRCLVHTGSSLMEKKPTLVSAMKAYREELSMWLSIYGK